MGCLGFHVLQPAFHHCCFSRKVAGYLGNMGINLVLAGIFDNLKDFTSSFSVSFVFSFYSFQFGGISINNSETIFDC